LYGVKENSGANTTTTKKPTTKRPGSGVTTTTTTIKPPIDDSEDICKNTKFDAVTKISTENRIYAFRGVKFFQSRFTIRRMHCMFGI